MVKLDNRAMASRAPVNTQMEKPVPGDNLTRLEAQERKAIVDVSNYDITLDLTAG